jgi:hypothetical protein
MKVEKKIEDTVFKTMALGLDRFRISGMQIQSRLAAFASDTSIPLYTTSRRRYAWVYWG